MAAYKNIDHRAVEMYAREHPEALQTDIALVFGITQGGVSYILRRAGLSNTHRGRCSATPPPAGHTSLTWAWEQLLRRLGFGGQRGERIGPHRIVYGFDPLKEALAHESVTLPEEDDGVVISQPFSRDRSIERYLPATKSESDDAGATCL